VVMRLLERASDHAVYIAGHAYYLVTGQTRNWPGDRRVRAAGRGPRAGMRVRRSAVRSNGLGAFGRGRAVSAGAVGVGEGRLRRTPRECF